MLNTLGYGPSSPVRGKGPRFYTARRPPRKGVPRKPTGVVTNDKVDALNMEPYGRSALPTSRVVAPRTALLRRFTCRRRPARLKLVVQIPIPLLGPPRRPLDPRGCFRLGSLAPLLKALSGTSWLRSPTAQVKTFYQILRVGVTGTRVVPVLAQEGANTST